MIKFLLLAYLLIALFIRIPDQLRAKQEIQDMQDSVQNVFDEMMVNNGDALLNSENIYDVIDHRPHHLYIDMKYKNMDKGISSNIIICFQDDSKLTINAPLYFSFGIQGETGGTQSNIFFAYYEEVDKLYIWGKRVGISWEEMEAYRDYLLYDIIINSYLDNGCSRFSMDNLGEFEVVDYLMPYEYCGMPEWEVERTEINEQGVRYITWVDTNQLLCVQQEIQHDDRRLDGYIRANLPAMISNDVFGREIGTSRFVVQLNGVDCRLSALITINNEFVDWIKNSGKAQGNLLRISADRESGCKKTQQMLQNCPEDTIKEILEWSEFYIEPGYLHIRFPYWDYEAKEPGFVKNGCDWWKGWLTVQTDDIGRFLRVEPW